MVLRVALEGGAFPLPPFAGAAERRRLFGIRGPRQEALELFPQPVRVDLAAVVRLLPRRLLDFHQGVQQGLRVQAHDLLLGEDLPDGLQQLQGAVAVLLADLLHRRLLGALRPFSAGRFRNAEQAAPVVAGSIEQLRRQGHGRKLREVGGPAGELAPALDEDGAVAVGQMLRLLFPGRLVQRQPDTAVLQGLGENFEPRESNAREGVELGGTPSRRPPSGQTG